MVVFYVVVVSRLVFVWYVVVDRGRWTMGALVLKRDLNLNLSFWHDDVWDDICECHSF
jgi:hypothetical protein